MKKIREAWFVAAFVLAWAAPGCGGSDGLDEVEDSYKGIVRGLCAAACDCGGSDGRIISLESENGSGYIGLGSEKIGDGLLITAACYRYQDE